MRKVRQESQAEAQQAQISTVQSYPAPIGGWNARDPLASMQPTDAIVLENWMPQTAYCEIRGGYTNSLTQMTGTGKTLAVYNGFGGTNKLFCVTTSGVYDASSAGAAGASLAARTVGKHQWLNFGDGTNNYLILVNGTDKPLYYDGTNWIAVDGVSSPALTGVTTTTIVGVNSFKGRLMFIVNNSLAFYYLAAGAAGGALTKFDLSGVAKKGGYLMAAATWTYDAGVYGVDDRAVFITSEGEIIIYQGDNPSSSSAWALHGVYYLGKPLGRHCTMQFGGDLVILTENGAYPMSAAIQSASINYKSALSFKIQNAFTDAARSYGGNFGWEAILYPAQSALIVNVPLAEDGQHEQYVMNTITKAWCKFTSWNAEAFAVFNKELYFTQGNTVYKAWTGRIDGANDIVAYGKQAFNYFGSLDQVKAFTMFRPILAVNGSLSYLTDFDVDFSDNPITGTATYAVSAGMVWDVSLWDQAYWAAALQIVKEWSSPAQWPGYCAAGKVKISTNTLNVQWIANDMTYEGGGILS